MEWIRRNRDMVAALVLIALVWAAFGGALQCGFVYFDDDQYVLENAAIARGCSWEGIRWAFTTGYVANWHPVTWLSHMMDVELFGMDPKAHHAVNLWLHALSAVVLFGVLRRLTGRFWPSFWVAALWCVHPLRTESVVWVAERKDVLAMLFGVLAVGAYAPPGQRGKMGWSSLFFALSLMSKPMWVTLPFVLLLLDVWPLKRWAKGAAKALVIEKWPLFLLAAVSCVVTYAVQQQGGAMGPLDAYPIGTRLVNAVVAYAEYIRLLFWPSGLAVLYPYPGAGHSGGRILLAAVVVLGLSAVAVAQGRRRPWLAVGWLWFLGTLVPMIGLVQVGRQSWADRYTYLPHIGLLVALVWGVAEMVGRGSGEPRQGKRKRKAKDPAPRGTYPGTMPVALAAALVLGAIALSRRQTAVWQSNESLFLHAISVTETNLLAHGNLGIYYGMRGQFEPAELHLQEVLRHNAQDGGAWYALGNVHQFQGRKEEALEHYLHAAEDPKQWKAMNNAAWLLATAPDGGARAEEALQWAHRALEAAPPDQTAGLWNTLSVARANAGDFDGAIQAAETAMALAKTSGDAALVQRMRSRIALFRDGQPFRE